MKHSFLTILLTLFSGLPAVLGQDITATITHESANGASDGAIDLTENGGFPPYEYSWKGPGGFTATTQDISGLAPGQYCVTVTDALCGTASLCRIVRRCDPILTASAGVRCPYNSNGYFTMWLSGAGTFNLQWSDGYTQTQQSTGGFTFVQRTGLDLGVYCVTVTNAYGCSESICRNVSSSIQPMQVTGTTQQPSCGTTTGSITLSVTGGASPYGYQWSDGAQTKDRTGLSAGTYTVTVSDKNGCTEDASFTISPSVSNLKISIAGISMVSNCISEYICDGLINIEISGGTPPYSYAWKKNGVLFSSQQDISNLCKALYQVNVTDASGCTAVKTVNICCCGDPGEPGHGGSGPVEGACGFEPITINGQTTQALGSQGGSINLSVDASSISFSLEWKKDGQYYSNEQNISNLQPGQYCVTVDNGCTTKSKCFTIVNCDNANITVTGTTNPTCEDYEAGAVDISVSGNGAIPYKYKWSNGSNNQDLEGLNAGTYTVTVTDNNGCTGSSSFTIGTTTIDIVDGVCIQYSYCGSEIVKVQEFSSEWDFYPTDCRFARIVCENYTGPYIDLGLDDEYPTGDPTDCTILWRCANGQVYDISYGTTETELVGGIDDCGQPYCAYISYCYYQDLGGYDENSVQLASYGNITSFPGDYQGPSCNLPGCSPISPCCKNKY